MRRAARLPRGVRAPLAVVCTFLLVTRHAKADDIADARSHFADGVRHFEQGDFGGARQLFEQADHEHHAPVILYNLARTEERLSHPQAAVDHYERYLAEAGPKGEFAQAAAVAVADLRAHSSRVRIESQPPGARVFVDGTPLGEATPTSTLLTAGMHHVVVEGDAWRGASDVEAMSGAEQTVAIARPSSPLPEAGSPPVAPSTSPPLPASPPPLPPPAPATEAPRPTPSGLVFGGTFFVNPYVFFGASATGPILNRISVGGIDVGLSGEIGYAFATRAEIVLRGLGALGSECPAFFGSHFLSAGPAIAYRVTSGFWMGMGLLGGNARSCRGAAVYSTDIVFSPSVDLAFAVSTHAYGQWVISASAAYYFANPTNDNRVLYFPVGFGVRFF